MAALIVVAVGFRLSALFLIRYGGTAPDWSDFRYYHELAALAAQGFLPDIHYWVEYPPIFPWIAVGAFRLSQLMPPWPQPYFWFDLFLSAVLAVADAASIVAIDRLGDAVWGKPAGRRSAALYAALFAPAWAILGWFDTLPTSCVLISLAIIVSRGGSRESSGDTTSERLGSSRALGASALAGFVAGLGIMLKIFPFLAIPAALVVGGHRGQASGASSRRSTISDFIHDPRTQRTAVVTIVAALTVVVIVLPFYLRAHDMIVASFRNVLARGSWESPWAILDGYTGTGTVAALRDRLFFTDSASWGQAARYPALWWLGVLVSAALYAWRALAARRLGTPRAAIALTGFGITLMLLLSRGFSQQFTLWVLPFIVLFLPGVGGALLAVVLTFNNMVVEDYLYATLFQQAFWLLNVAIAVRTAILIWLLIELGTAIDESASQRWHNLRRYLRVPSLLGVIVALALVVGVVWPNVKASTIERSATGPLLAALNGGSPASAVIFTQPAVYDRLAWFVRPRQAVLIAEPKFLEWTGDRSLNYRLDAVLRNAPDAIILTDSSEPASPLVPAIGRWLDAHYGRRPDQTVGTIHLSDYRASDRPPEKSIGARFGDQLELRGYSPIALKGKPGAPLAVTLHWLARTAIERDYTMSVQLLNPDGTLAVQHDAMPVDNSFPTSTWAAGLDVFDRIELPLPAQLKPGTYTLIVIAYHQPTSTRLQVAGTGDHASLTTVEVGA